MPVRKLRRISISPSVAERCWCDGGLGGRLAICIGGMGPTGELGPGAGAGSRGGNTMGGWKPACGWGDVLRSPDDWRDTGESDRCRRCRCCCCCCCCCWEAAWAAWAVGFGRAG